MARNKFVVVCSECVSNCLKHHQFCQVYYIGSHMFVFQQQLQSRGELFKMLSEWAYPTCSGQEDDLIGRLSVYHQLCYIIIEIDTYSYFDLEANFISSEVLVKRVPCLEGKYNTKSSQVNICTCWSSSYIRNNRNWSTLYMVNPEVS